MIGPKTWGFCSAGYGHALAARAEPEPQYGQSRRAMSRAQAEKLKRLSEVANQLEPNRLSPPRGLFFASLQSRIWHGAAFPVDEYHNDVDALGNATEADFCGQLATHRALPTFLSPPKRTSRRPLVTENRNRATFNDERRVYSKQ